MIDFRTHREGLLLPVRAQPGARQNKLGGAHNGSLRVAVTTAPENGKANQAIIELLSKSLGLAKSDIRLVRGVASREKLFLLRTTEPDTIVKSLNH